MFNWLFYFFFPLVSVHEQKKMMITIMNTYIQVKLGLFSFLIIIYVIFFWFIVFRWFIILVITLPPLKVASKFNFAVTLFVFQITIHPKVTTGPKSPVFPLGGSNFERKVPRHDENTTKILQYEV